MAIAFWPCKRVVTLLLFSLLILSIVSTTIPTTRAAARAGKIILNPTHALPGTLVTFEGVGWGLQPAYGDGLHLTQCKISGEPVKVDRRYLPCEVKYRGGTYEPVGAFMVADVPAGTYLLSVSATFLRIVITAKQEFTVDAVTTSTAVTTLATSTAPSSTPIVTVSATVTTTKVETPKGPDYAVMSLVLLIVAIALVAIVALLILPLPGYRPYKRRPSATEI